VDAGVQLLVLTLVHVIAAPFIYSQYSPQESRLTTTTRSTKRALIEYLALHHTAICSTYSTTPDESGNRNHHFGFVPPHQNLLARIDHFHPKTLLFCSGLARMGVVVGGGL
jgi:hypothetical protein